MYYHKTVKSFTYIEGLGVLVDHDKHPFSEGFESQEYSPILIVLSNTNANIIVEVYILLYLVIIL